MGKVVVSTSAGIHGLALRDCYDVVIAETGAEMAAAISRLLESEEERGQLERQARKTVEESFGWEAIGRTQKKLYEELRCP